jgi:hypothetical protein
MIPAPAASAVMSLYCPKAMPTVAAVRAGASLIPSQKDRICLLGLLPDQFELLLGTLAEVDFLDTDLIGKIAHFGLPITGNQQDPIEAVFRAQMMDE